MMYLATVADYLFALLVGQKKNLRAFHEQIQTRKKTKIRKRQRKSKLKQFQHFDKGQGTMDNGD